MIKVSKNKHKKEKEKKFLATCILLFFCFLTTVSRVRFLSFDAHWISVPSARSNIRSLPRVAVSK